MVMDVYEAKCIAITEYKKSIPVHAYTWYEAYIIVSDQKGEALSVGDLDAAVKCNPDWLFRCRMVRGKMDIKLIK